MSDSESQPEQEPKQDARLQSFMRRAAPIIAAERGLTAGARIKLQSIAAEMRLPGELLDEALLDLQHTAQKGRRYSRWERAYARSVAAQLKELENGILNSLAEQKLLQRAQERFQLSLPQARDIVTEVTKQLSIRRISASDAERHVEAVIKDAIGSNIRVEPSIRERVFSIGEEWGVSKQHVAAFLDYYIRRNRDRQAAQQRRSTLLVAAIGLAFLCALATIIYLGLTWKSPGVATATDTQPQPDTHDTGLAQPPQWWTPPLETGIANLLARQPTFRETALLLADSDESQRTLGYRHLLDLWLENLDNRDTKGRIENVLKQLVVAEPTDALVTQFIDEFLYLAQPPADGLPSGNQFYEQGLAVVETTVILLQQDGLDGSRSRPLQQQLNQLTGTFLATVPSGNQAVRRYQTDYVNQLFIHLLGNAAGNARLANERYDQLRRLAGSMISEEEQMKRSTQLLTEILSNDPLQWERFEDLMDVCITPDNRENLPQLIEVLETTSSSELQRELTGRFRRQFRLANDNDDPLTVSTEIRRALGLSLYGGTGLTAVTWSRLTKSAADSLAPRDDIPPTEIDAQRLIDINYWGTLAVELAIQADRTTIVDEEINDGPPQLNSSDTDSPLEIPPELFSDMTDRDRRLLDRVNQIDQAAASSTISNLRALGRRLDEGLRIDGQEVEAQTLARYLFSPRPDVDQKKLLAELGPLSQWSRLLLVVADEIDRSGASPEQSQAITSALLAEELILDGSLSPEGLKAALLQRAVDQLSRESSTTPTSPAWLQSQQQWRQLQLRRIQLFEPTATLPEDSLPGECTTRLVNAFCQWARNRTPAVETTPGFRNLDAALRSDSYLARDDLQQTVAMQRLLNHALADWLGKIDRDLQQRAQDIYQEYMTQLESREEVMTQVFDGEQTWLRLWLLRPQI